MNLSRNQIIAAIVLLAAALLGTGFMVAKSGSFSKAGEGVQLIEEEGADDAAVEAGEPLEPEKLCIHVAGRVNKAGVYELPPDSRVKDALAAAGGALDDADLETINLAQRLTDGQQVYIARKGQVAPPAASTVLGQSTSPGEPSPAVPSTDKAQNPSSQKLKTPGDGKVNINTAGANELQRLPGVGPSTARKILDYRSQHGRFNSVDELEEVSGIGPAKLAQMRPFVTL